MIFKKRKPENSSRAAKNMDCGDGVYVKRAHTGIKQSVTQLIISLPHLAVMAAVPYIVLKCFYSYLILFYWLSIYERPLVKGQRLKDITNIGIKYLIAWNSVEALTNHSLKTLFLEKNIFGPKAAFIYF